MDISLFFIVILSHILFDFVFQNEFILKMRFPKSKSYIDNKLKEKTSLRIKERLYKSLYSLSIKKRSIVGNVIHSTIHLIGIYIVSAMINLINGQAVYVPLYQVLLISISHFIVDELKSLLYLKDIKLIENIWVFWLDQLLHLIFILLILSICNNINLINMLREKILIYPNGFSLNEKLLIVFINVSIATWGVGIFIKILMHHLSSNNNKTDFKIRNWSQNNKVINKDTLEEDAGAPNGGFIIGLLERTFILVSIVINYPMMIGFILTIKSVARFKKLSNDSFAEYFIIGTFLSFIPALLLGIIIRSLFF
ncbi:DUF3307 domain-containing protein [Clostridium gasigenes]|uniref:DUF3307 domain-containing protein n=1 Tax=Clostridium gasigenes TaxID=94869 RepID=UPI001C0AF1A5|nr:DUF3307 domain-containing protein [Clostridium gasigenes]